MREIVKNLITLLLHFGIATGLIIITNNWILGLYFYLFIILIFFRIIPRNHVRGVKYLNSNELKKAYDHFEKSLELFDNYKFIDKFGFIFLLNMSDYTYRECALLNQALICYKSEKEKEAKKLYEKVLIINSRNRIARKRIELIKNKK